MKEYTLFLTFFSPFQKNIPPSVPNIPLIPDLNKTLTILDFMSQEFDAVRIVGGEPLITPTFNEIIDFAVERYREISVESIGAGDVFRSAYNIKRQISEGSDIEIIFQLIDMDPSVNDKVLGTGAWETVISAATLVQSTFDIPPKIAMYIGSHSTHRYSLLTKLGFDLILRRAYGMKVTERSVSTMFQLAQYENVTVEDCVYSAINNGYSCTMPKYVLDSNGNIYISRFAPDVENPIGNVFGMTMEDIHNAVANAFKPIQEAKLGGKCSKCAYAEICGGGDFHYWESLKEAYDPVCPIREEAVDELAGDEEEELAGGDDVQDFSEEEFIDDV